MSPQGSLLTLLATICTIVPQVTTALTYSEPCEYVGDQRSLERFTTAILTHGTAHVCYKTGKVGFTYEATIVQIQDDRVAVCGEEEFIPKAVANLITEAGKDPAKAVILGDKKSFAEKFLWSRREYVEAAVPDAKGRRNVFRCKTSDGKKEFTRFKDSECLTSNDLAGMDTAAFLEAMAKAKGRRCLVASNLRSYDALLVAGDKLAVCYDSKEVATTDEIFNKLPQKLPEGITYQQELVPVEGTIIATSGRTWQCKAGGINFERFKRV